MDYLFLVNIGPVQPFIASGRRTRDLYVGSTLLSELSKAAAKCIADTIGKDYLIFPAPENEQDLLPDSGLNVANKILAHIQYPPSEVARKVENAIRERLRNIKDAAYADVRGEVNTQLAEAQIEDLVEYSWVAVPFTEDQYDQGRRRVEAVLNARKNTRHFKPASGGNNTLKSSIDGQLEGVIPGKYYPRRADQAKRQRMIQDLYSKYRAGPDERLSGVDLLKRYAEFKEIPMILSTSHVAALPFLHRLATSKDTLLLDMTRVSWNNYLKSISDVLGPQQEKSTSPILEKIKSPAKSHSLLGSSDGGMLFEERLLEDIADPASLIPIREKYQAFLKSVDALVGARVRPEPYYAILVADGDSMGKVIEHQAKSGMGSHRNLSRRLDTFAREVKGIVEHYQGTKVYAGGDDVLAFLPLHTVLPCAQALAKRFKDLLRRFTAADDATPTLSVGIAIVHHLELLQDALAIARASETKAKEYKKRQKNALAITVHKRSGEEYTTVGKWGKIDLTLKYLIDLYKNKELPGGTAYEIREMAERLKPEKMKQKENESATEQEKRENNEKILQVIQIDTLRILKRKLGVPRQKMSKEREKQLLAWFRQRLFMQQNSDGELIVTETCDIETFIHELLVARILADASTLAGTPLGEYERVEAL